MTQYLPPNLLALFAPRDPIPYFAPLDQLPELKKPWPYTGVSQYLHLFEDPSETPAPTKGETKEQRVIRKRQNREERQRKDLEDALNNWEANKDQKNLGDPFKTLFVGRINYDTSDSKLRREFEQYGPIKRIVVVTDTEKSKPRGYAFIEYEHERDMHAAFKYGDGKKIDGKRVVVDIERGRTVKTWRPRRLGGGLGGTRRGAPHENIKYSGRVDERDMERSGSERGDRDRDRDRDRERRAERSRDRDKDRDPHSRERDREKDRKHKRSRSRERDHKERSRSRDRDDKKDRDRKEDRKDERKDKDSKENRSSKKDKEKDKERREKRKDKDMDNSIDGMEV